MNKNKIFVKSIRIPAEVNEEIAKAAARMDTAEMDVIRIALKIGLKSLANINYDITQAIMDKSDKGISHNPLPKKQG